MKINKFKPIKYEVDKVDFTYLPSEKSWKYASSGKAALFHILSANPNIQHILLPSYICRSILKPLEALHIKYNFYDCSIDSFNTSLAEIKVALEVYKPSAILVASMYGFPAPLTLIEKFCKKEDIFLIDDAAQSFGATSEGREVGTFGDAGFFSFSPGKPTPGHLGAFFWTNNHSYCPVYKKSTIYNLLKYLIFKQLRVRVDSLNIFNEKIFIILNRVISILPEGFYRGARNFDLRVMSAILKSSKDSTFRNYYYESFLRLNTICTSFTVFAPKLKLSDSVPHKLILLTSSKIRDNFIQILRVEYQIYSSPGYFPLSIKHRNSLEFSKKIIELPIEDDEYKMNYLFESLIAIDSRILNDSLFSK